MSMASATHARLAVPVRPTGHLAVSSRRRNFPLRAIAGPKHTTGQLSHWLSEGATQGKLAEKADQPGLQGLTRRSHLLGVCLLSVAGLPAFADETPELETVKDPIDAFEISIPKGWANGQGEIGSDGGIAAAATRRALAWFPEDKPADVNVTLVITNTAADFTSLSSFGTDYDFGTNLVNSMDRSYLLRGPKWARKRVNEEDIQVAKLLSTKSVNGGYLIEYSVQNTKVDKHLTSFVFLGFNGRYNRLYTITAQCPREELEAYGSTFQAICKSFKAPLVA